MQLRSHLWGFAFRELHHKRVTVVRMQGSAYPATSKPYDLISDNGVVGHTSKPHTLVYVPHALVIVSQCRSP
jgi:hypothetical protein